MYKKSDNVIKYITKAMKNWKVELTAESQSGRSENPNNYLAGTLTLDIVICYNNNAINYIISKWTRATNLQHYKKNKPPQVFEGYKNITQKGK